MDRTNLLLTLKKSNMKKVFLLLTLALVTSVSYAQGPEKALKQYGFWDNWFIQGQIGVQHTFSESHKYSSFGQELSPTAAFSLGKFYSPEVGSRIQLGGWTSRNHVLNTGYNVKYFNTNLDALFNLTNIFAPYKENRVFNLIGILGIGYVHSFKNTDLKVPSENVPSHTVAGTNSVSPRIGLQMDFRLSKALSFNLEGNGNLLRDNFNGQEKFRTNYDGTMNVLAGFTYYFRNRGFNTVEAADPALIQSLNDMINTQRGQIEEYKACCEKKQITPEPQTIIKEVVVKENQLNAVITFRIGKANVEKSQRVTLYNVAQYMKQNPNEKLTIASYADKKTGTAAFNQKLSEKRSATVANILNKEYGISKDRFIVESYGDKQQPYPDNNSWNRITIMTSK